MALVYVYMDHGIHKGRKRKVKLLEKINYSKFASISLEHFFEHKHLISEECAMGAGHVGTESVLYLRVVMLSR